MIQVGNIYSRKYLSKPDLHHVSSDGQSTLLRLINGFSYNYFAEDLDLSIVLDMWLNPLQDSHIELNEYARKEHALYIHNPMAWRFEQALWDEDDQRLKHVCLFVVHFIYGSLPSDWKITMEEMETSEDDSVQIRAG